MPKQACVGWLRGVDSRLARCALQEAAVEEPAMAEEPAVADEPTAEEEEQEEAVSSHGMLDLIYML